MGSSTFLEELYFAAMCSFRIMQVRTKGPYYGLLSPSIISARTTSHWLLSTEQIAGQQWLSKGRRSLAWPFIESEEVEFSM
jgi:hypothetical protein